MFNTTHFPKAIKYWHMGKLHEWTEPNIHPMTHGLHYGSSVFEGIRAYSTSRGPSIFRLPEHIDRFFHSASVACMKVPYTKKEIINAIKLVVRENHLDAAYIRPLLYYSYGNLGLVPKFCPVELCIGAWEWGVYLGDKAKKGAHGYIVPWRRIHHSQFDMSAKLGGVYIQSTICGLLARSHGFHEAVFLNLEGNVAEGPGENIFIVKNELLKTNDKSESILEGITRATLLEIAKDIGIQTAIGPITKEEFIHADEAFFSGTAVEVVPITQVTDDSNPKSPMNEHTIGEGQAGAITKTLVQRYRDIVRGKLPAYERWMTYVSD